MSGDIDRRLAEAIRVAEEDKNSCDQFSYREDGKLSYADKMARRDLSILRALATCREALKEWEIVTYDPEFGRRVCCGTGPDAPHHAECILGAALLTDPFPSEPT